MNLNMQEFQTLLTVQSQGYKDALQLFITRFDSQFDKLLQRLQDLERNNSEKDKLNNDLLNHIVKVEQELESVKKDKADLEGKVAELQQKTTTLEDRCNNLEDRSRRNNLRIFGLPLRTLLAKNDL